jgi:hypothetical protein
MKTKDLEMVIMKPAEAKDFMKKHHYTRTASKCKYGFGFYYKGNLSTVIIYGQPSGKFLAQSLWENGNEKQCLELVRLFSFDWSIKNTESYCISQSIKYLKKNHPEIKMLVSYADASMGHIGYIYQASNWLYVGKSNGEREFYIDDKREHRRELYDKYGTSSIKKLKELLGERFRVSEDKHFKNKYIYVLGRNKGEHKELLRKLKLEIHNQYPKGEIKYYHIEQKENI